MYDLDITLVNGRLQFERLFKTADEYDDMLKREYECIDRLVEK